MGEAEVYKALEKLAGVLDSLGIPYAIIGAMALNEFGYQRTTVDGDVLLTATGLATFKASHLGPGRREVSREPRRAGHRARSGYRHRAGQLVPRRRQA